MDYTPYKESECAFEYNLSVYDYIKKFKSIFCSNEMYMNQSVYVCFYLIVSVFICFYLYLSVFICLYMFLSVFICFYLFIYVYIYFLSVYICFITVYISLYLFMPQSTTEFMNKICGSLQSDTKKNPDNLLVFSANSTGPKTSSRRVFCTMRNEIKVLFSLIFRLFELQKLPIFSFFLVSYTK